MVSRFVCVYTLWQCLTPTVHTVFLVHVICRRMVMAFSCVYYALVLHNNTETACNTLHNSSLQGQANHTPKHSTTCK